MLESRIATVDDVDGSQIALVGDDGLHYLKALVPDAPSDMRELIVAWSRWEAELAAAARRAADRRPDLELGAARWRPPLIPGKLLCVGANYHDHVAEMDAALGLSTPPPPFPFSFLKPPTALIGSGTEVPRPAFGVKLDWEVELAVVIGDPALASGPDPLAAVFGYTIVNDLSLRDFIPFPHALGLDAVVSKGFDGAAPLGPWITRAQAVGDPNALRISLSLNGELMQDSTTAEMIFDVPALIAHFARVLTLEPGDIIATGTPAGVGQGRRPPRFLAPGDRMEARIDGLGMLQTTIGEPAAGGPLIPDREVNA